VNLSTVERIKAALGTNPTSAIDDQLTPLLRSVSARAKQYLNREVEIIERVETVDLEEGQTMVALRAWPIDMGEAFEVFNDASREFGDETLVEPEGYYVDEDRGLLFLDPFVPVTGRRVLRVVYTGGMGAVDGTDGETSEEFIAAYPDIAQAVDTQCAEMHRRRDRLGATSTSFQGGGTSYEGPVKLLPLVTSMLDPHRRAIGR
jgi:hypothetical protein